MASSARKKNRVAAIYAKQSAAMASFVPPIMHALRDSVFRVSAAIAPPKIAAMAARLISSATVDPSNAKSAEEARPVAPIMYALRESAILAFVLIATAMVTVATTASTVNLRNANQN